MTPKEYLESVLQEQEGFSAKAQEKNRIRQLIKQYFRSRHCYTLIRPSDDEKAIQHLGKGGDFASSIKDEFIDQIEELKIFIFNRIKPMRMNNGL